MSLSRFFSEQRSAQSGSTSKEGRTSSNTPCADVVALPPQDGEQFVKMQAEFERRSKATAAGHTEDIVRGK